MANKKKRQPSKTPNGLRLIVGIEVESEYNQSEMGHLPESGYHSNYTTSFGDFFIVESDSTINSTKFMGGSTAELISVPFDSDDADAILKSFKKETYRRVARKHQKSVTWARKNIPFDEIFHFNTSTGCHIHVTALRPTQKKFIVRFKNIQFEFKGTPIMLGVGSTMKRLNDITEALKRNMKPILKERFGAWSRHLGRGQSRIRSGISQARRSSWNFTIRNDKNQLEYRSFNLLGVKTWGEFEKVIKTGLRTIKEELRKEMNSKQPFLEETEVTLREDDVNNYFPSRKEEIVVNDYKGGVDGV